MNCFSDIFKYNNPIFFFMVNNSLLSSVNGKHVNDFEKDLRQMLRVGKWMDRYYSESNSDVDVYLKKFKCLIDKFNRKYKNIKIAIVKKITGIETKLLLNEKNVKEAFENSASKIIGVQSIGRNKFGAALVSNQEKFAGELENAKDKLYITYYNAQTGNSNVFFNYDKKEKKVALVYDLNEIENKQSAEFQIAAFYALKNGNNKKIDLHDEAATLGFSSILTHVEKREWFEKFDPHCWE
jgi:hypothetical protein|tara:strand:- start:50393 stop:51109 length:717 start_codon:yes stop_codon:yes gene_type:complete